MTKWLFAWTKWLFGNKPFGMVKKTLGLVNYGNGTSDVDKVATQAFVMMLVSLNENWKLPVGYFFVDGLTAEIKSNLVNICLTKFGK